MSESKSSKFNSVTQIFSTYRSFMRKKHRVSYFSPIIHTCLGAIILLAKHNSCDHRQICVEGSKKNALRQKRLPKPSEIWPAMQQGRSSLSAEFSPFPLSKSHLLYSYLMMGHCYIMFAVLARSNLKKPVSHLNHIYLFKTTEIFPSIVTSLFLDNSSLNSFSADISINVQTIVQGTKYKCNGHKAKCEFSRANLCT